MSKEQQILMLGILSLLCCSLLGPLAWLQANEALGMIDSGAYSAEERGLVAAGQEGGMIGASLLVLQVLILFMWFAGGGTHRSY